MSFLELGVIGTSSKPDERRRPIHPGHFDRIDEDLRAHLHVEQGYGGDFGVPDEEIAPFVASLRPRAELMQQSDVEQLQRGAVLWGWPHLVQDLVFTQLAIDRELTVIAWESMNHWNEGVSRVHVFHLNNEIAGDAAVQHAMQLRGMTGHYGRALRAVVISFGATARGAVTALHGLGVSDAVVLTSRDVPAVAAPMATVMGQFEVTKDDPTKCQVLKQEGPPVPMATFLADFDVIVHCVFQDTDHPLMFIDDSELALLAPGTVIVDVSCDTGMGFAWARPMTFQEPMVEVGDRIHHYGIDHTPSYLWDSSTWTISEALIPHLRTVLSGPTAWGDDEVIDRAVEVQRGRIRNERVLSFQDREPEYPHLRR